MELARLEEYHRVADAYAMEKRVQGSSRAKREARTAGGGDAIPRRRGVVSASLDAARA